jgi:hypothetical protein
VDQRDEQEIETRLRAALMARSEQVTHQTLRPGVVPNSWTASAPAKARRAWSFSWRGALIPAMVAAALAGGVFVGVKLPQHDSNSRSAVGPGAGGGSASELSPSPATSTVQGSPSSTPVAPLTLAGVRFQPLDWTVTKLTETKACVAPPQSRPADPSAMLPCGPDALMITSGLTPGSGSWPVDTAQDKTGWWPVKNAVLSEIPCPSAKQAAAGTTPAPAVFVTTSVLLRHDDHYPLAGTAEAVYQDWSVTCGGTSSGFRPMLWELDGGKIAVTALDVTVRNDRDLLGIVGSMQLANQ